MLLSLSRGLLQFTRSWLSLPDLNGETGCYHPGSTFSPDGLCPHLCDDVNGAQHPSTCSSWMFSPVRHHLRTLLWSTGKGALPTFIQDTVSPGAH